MSDPSYHFSLFGNHYDFTPKLTLLTLLIIGLLCGLGMWQLHEADSIRETVQLANKRINLEPLDFDELHLKTDLRFYPVVLKGSFDDEHQILLPNRTRKGQEGYEVLTPFKPSSNPSFSFLVDRGWMMADMSSQKLPRLRPVPDGITISGILFKPTHYLLYSLFNNDFDEKDISWPLISKRANLTKFSKALNTPLFPYVILLSPSNPYGFVREWIWLTTQFNPEKNEIFAKQWFALAFLMFLVFIFANLKRRDTE